MLARVRGWFDPEMIWTPPPSGKCGQQRHFSDAAVQTCLMLKILFGMPLGQTTEFPQSLLRLVGLGWVEWHQISAPYVVHCMKLLGQSLMPRDFERQVGEIQIRIAVLNRYTALGIPITKAVGSGRLGKGEQTLSEADLCNNAVHRS